MRNSLTSWRYSDQPSLGNTEDGLILFENQTWQGEIPPKKKVVDDGKLIWEVVLLNTLYLSPRFMQKSNTSQGFPVFVFFGERIVEAAHFRSWVQHGPNSFRQKLYRGNTMSGHHRHL